MLKPDGRGREEKEKTRNQEELDIVRVGHV
jgi:hypothetical protein